MPGRQSTLESLTGAGLAAALRSRLCWQVSFTVVLAIIFVATAILTPAYLIHESTLVDELRDKARIQMAAHFRLISHGSDRDLKIAGRILMQGSTIAGAVIRDAAGREVAAFGERPALAPARAEPAGARLPTPPAERLDVHWTVADTGLPYAMVARLDTSSIVPQLNRFIARMSVVIAVVALFVGALTQFILGWLLMQPLSRLRAHLQAVERTPDDANRHLLSAPRFGEFAGMVDAFNNLLRRVSERGRDNLESSERRFRDFAAAASDFFWETGPDLRLSYVSGRFAEITGTEPVAVLREPLGAIEAGADGRSTARDRLTAETVAGHAFRGVVITCRGATEAPVHVSLNGRPMVDGEGRFLGYRGTGTDVTAFWQARKALLAAKELAESASHAKSQFLANMSHELRTPLNAIIGFSEIMCQGRMGPLSSAKYQEYAIDIHASALHLLAIISDILDLTKIEAGTAELDETAVDLGLLMVACETIMGERAKAADIHLAMTTDAELPAVWADERKLKQIVINLLSNAVKFSPAGGRVSVHVAVDRSRAMAITVTDTGAGMAPEDLPLALSPFTQLDDQMNRLHEGTGLGLPLAKSLIELHGGSLTIDSVVGRGTAVTIRLPADRLMETSKFAGRRA